MDEVTIKKPNECSPRELEDFVSFVCKANPVEKRGVSAHVKEAVCLVQLTRACMLLGTAALKVPLKTWREKVSNNARIDLSAKAFPFELGYVAVDASLQNSRFSNCLVAAAVTRSEGSGLFATTFNERMVRALRSNGFQEAGDAFPSQQSRGAKLRLLIRPAR